MKSSRLEAFSDGVLAIIITIMVLELETPEEATFEALILKAPIFVSYLISFIYVGIYWSNHHHLFQITEKINGKVLLANLHLLFWLSLIPFTTSWIGKNLNESAPVALYGFVLLMSAISYTILQNTIIKHHDDDFVLKKAIGGDLKGKLSLLIYLAGFLLSFVNTWIGISAYIIVVIIWIIPDKRVEKNIN